MAKINTLSLFTGAGGLDLGFEFSGFETIGAVEVDEDARRTLQKNRPSWKLTQTRHLARSNVENLLSELPGVEAASALVGGPPCQPFSKASQWATGEWTGTSDHRFEAVAAMLKVAKIIKPDIIVLENVPGFASPSKGGIRSVRAHLGHINRTEGTKYRLSVWHLNAADFGVPQLRRRVFLIAFKDGRVLEAPRPLFGTRATPPKRYRNTWDALEDLAQDLCAACQASKSKWLDLLPSVPEGGNYLHLTQRGSGDPVFGWRTRYWSFLLKLAKDTPAWTVPANPGPSTGPFHWNNRPLTIREQARLQTFPDSWAFEGTTRSQVKQIGNAVPCALAAAVGTEIFAAYSGVVCRDWEKVLIPIDKGTPPPPVPPSPVPPHHKLNYRPPDHPGQGKGPGARRRNTSEQPTTRA